MQSAITVIGFGSAILTSPLALARIARTHLLHPRNGIDRSNEHLCRPGEKPQVAALEIKALASTARVRRKAAQRMEQPSRRIIANTRARKGATMITSRRRPDGPSPGGVTARRPQTAT